MEQRSSNTSPSPPPLPSSLFLRPTKRKNQASAPSTRRARRSPTTSRTRSTFRCSPGSRAGRTTTPSRAWRARCTRPRGPSSSRIRGRCSPTPRPSPTVRERASGERRVRRWRTGRDKEEEGETHCLETQKNKKNGVKKLDRPPEARPHARLRRHRQPHRARRPAPGRRRRLARRARVGASFAVFFFFLEVGESSRVAVARGGEAGSGGCWRGSRKRRLPARRARRGRPAPCPLEAHRACAAACRPPQLEGEEGQLPPPLLAAAPAEEFLEGGGYKPEKTHLFFHFENRTKKRRSSPTSPPTRTPSPATSRPSFREASAWAPPP